MTRKVRYINGKPHLRCNMCGKWLPADHDHFPRRERFLMECNSNCKKCESEYNSAYKKNRTKLFNKYKSIIQKLESEKTDE